MGGSHGSEAGQRGADQHRLVREAVAEWLRSSESESADSARSWSRLARELRKGEQFRC
jgi:hypothetical protein